LSNHEWSADAKRRSVLRKHLGSVLFDWPHAQYVYLLTASTALLCTERQCAVRAFKYVYDARSAYILSPNQADSIVYAVMTVRDGEDRDDRDA